MGKDSEEGLHSRSPRLIDPATQHPATQHPATQLLDRSRNPSSPSVSRANLFRGCPRDSTPFFPNSRDMLGSLFGYEFLNGIEEARTRQTDVVSSQ